MCIGKQQTNAADGVIQKKNQSGETALLKWAKEQMTRGKQENKKTELNENVWKVRKIKQILNLEKNIGLEA